MPATADAACDSLSPLKGFLQVRLSVRLSNKFANTEQIFFRVCCSRSGGFELRAVRQARSHSVCLDDRPLLLDDTGPAVVRKSHISKSLCVKD